MDNHLEGEEQNHGYSLPSHWQWNKWEHLEWSGGGLKRRKHISAADDMNTFPHLYSLLWFPSPSPQLNIQIMKKKNTAILFLVKNRRWCCLSRLSRSCQLYYITNCKGLKGFFCFCFISINARCNLGFLCAFLSKYTHHVHYCQLVSWKENICICVQDFIFPSHKSCTVICVMRFTMVPH